MCSYCLHLDMYFYEHDVMVAHDHATIDHVQYKASLNGNLQDWIWHECAPKFVTDLFSEYLGHLYDVHHIQDPVPRQ